MKPVSWLFASTACGVLLFAPDRAGAGVVAHLDRVIEAYRELEYYKAKGTVTSLSNGKAVGIGPLVTYEVALDRTTARLRFEMHMTATAGYPELRLLLVSDGKKLRVR